MTGWATIAIQHSTRKLHLTLANKTSEFTMDTFLIEREALHLPVSERAKLAHKLIISLENMSESEIEEVWFDEAARRANEIDQGFMQLIPADEVSRKARELLR